MKPHPGPWTGRSLGTRWQHACFYGLIRVVGRVGAYVLSDAVALWYVLTRSAVRDQCAPYLARRFPERRGLFRLLDAWRLSRELGRILVDRAALGILGPQALSSVLEGPDLLGGLIAENRGLVILTAHVGAWQLGMVCLSLLEAPVTVVMHRNPGDVDRQFFEHRPGPHPFRTVDPASPMGGVLSLYGALERKEVLCFMGDRVMPGAGGLVEVDFLGDPMPVPFGPFKLASATGAPVAICFFHKPERDSFELKVVEVLRLPPDLGRKPEAYRPYAQAFANALTTFVTQRPYHYFNFYDLWAPRPSQGVEP